MYHKKDIQMWAQTKHVVHPAYICLAVASLLRQ